MMPSTRERTETWSELRRRARLRLLRMHFESRVGHIGGNLSCLDLMLALHHDVLRPGDHSFGLSLALHVRAFDGAF